MRMNHTLDQWPMARVTLWFYSEFYLNLEVHAGFLSSQAKELKISTVVTCQ